MGRGDITVQKSQAKRQARLKRRTKRIAETKRQERAKKN
jgi:hypothetical protein